MDRRRERTDAGDESSLDERVDSLDRFERTIDVQLSLIDAIDRKAANVVRYTTLLVGAIFTALSVVSRSDVLALDEIGVLARVTFYVGVVAFVSAIGVAIVTYSSSVRKYGPNASYGQAVADGAIETPRYEQTLLVGYADAVRANRRVVYANARRFRWALAGLLVGTVYTTLAGILVTLGGSPHVELLLTATTSMLIAPTGYRIYEEEFLVLERRSTTNE